MIKFIACFFIFIYSKIKISSIKHVKVKGKIIIMKNQLISTIYVPVNTIISSSLSWLNSLNLPVPTTNDYKIINELRSSSILPYIGGNIINSRQFIVDSNACIRKVKSLSFYDYLLNKMINDAKIYAEAGIKNFILQNSNEPYFSKQDRQPVIYWIMRLLAIELRLIVNQEFQIGIKINKDMYKWSMDIACRTGLHFIYSNNDENILAKLLLQRNMMKNNKVKIYNLIENKFLLKSEGLIYNNTDIDTEMKLIDNKNNIKCYKDMYLFYYKDNELPLIIDIKDYQKDLMIYKNKCDYIIMNCFFNKNNYADCEIDQDKLMKFIQKF